ncbi:MAG: malto-oligosyltrehalose trehalohydrolase [Pirellulales bacterium]
MKQQSLERRLPVGAEAQPGGGVHFRVWAPRRKRVTAVYGRQADAAPKTLSLAGESGGYFAGTAADAGPGTRYGFRLDDDEQVFPDPASRFQPDGVHGLSEVIDASTYRWRDTAWRGLPLHGQVLYELHLGTFTREGTWRAAAGHLPRLKELGVTLVEVMPVAEFAGEYGWGYDGVDLFAPTRLYGRPDDFRAFVDAAHQAGLGVILDVVYNHFGPTGNYLGQYSKNYLSHHGTDWGESVNYDGENSAAVREFVVSNAGYWIDEYHIDGLRLDAVHAIHDDSDDHILAALTRRVREAARGRKTLIFAENEFQQCRLMRPADQGGYGLDAGWNDDFHHAARVAATGNADYYYADYQGSANELISAVKWGYLYQGQWNPRQGRRRGTPGLDLEAAHFVNFLQNHDQVSNSPHGRRLHDLTSPGRHRALTALLALAPGTPLLFQGQEFSASAPFHFFADHEPELNRLVREGRQGFMKTFLRLAGTDAAAPIDPAERRTFEASQLDWSECERHIEAYALHRDLFRLRRADAVFARQRADRIHASAITPEALLLRYVGDNGDDRLVLINLGRDLDWQPMTDPLAAPPEGHAWQLLWSSEDARYGGWGTRALEAERWHIQGQAALVLRAVLATDSLET